MTKQRIAKLVLQQPIVDILFLPATFFSAIILLFVRKIGFVHLKYNKSLLTKVGVMPIRNHYYEPLFDEKLLTHDLKKDRYLPGIDLNVNRQLSILYSFSYGKEFSNIRDEYLDDLTFHFNNGSFGSGDAEYWYSIIRLKKPKRIIEVGSGHSTKIAQLAIQQNVLDDSMYSCEHICIEPYEMPWLERLGIKIIRERVELVDKSFFKQLNQDDILFIDSSHMIRPQGDVLFEFLEIVPTLNKGVIVHVHDIFTPKDYPKEWLLDEVKFWNEQYLLEAFITSNHEWEIIGALNFLRHNYYNLLKDKCPRLQLEREPGSFYMQKLM